MKRCVSSCPERERSGCGSLSLLVATSITVVRMDDTRCLVRLDNIKVDSSVGKARFSPVFSVESFLPVKKVKFDTRYLNRGEAVSPKQVAQKYGLGEVVWDPVRTEAFKGIPEPDVSLALNTVENLKLKFEDVAAFAQSFQDMSETIRLETAAHIAKSKIYEKLDLPRRRARACALLTAENRVSRKIQPSIHESDVQSLLAKIKDVEDLCKNDKEKIQLYEDVCIRTVQNGLTNEAILLKLRTYLPPKRLHELGNLSCRSGRRADDGQVRVGDVLSDAKYEPLATDTPKDRSRSIAKVVMEHLRSRSRSRGKKSHADKLAMISGPVSAPIHLNAKKSSPTLSRASSSSSKTGTLSRASSSSSKKSGVASVHSYTPPPEDAKHLKKFFGSKKGKESPPIHFGEPQFHQSSSQLPYEHVERTKSLKKGDRRSTTEKMLQAHSNRIKSGDPLEYADMSALSYRRGSEKQSAKGRSKSARRPPTDCCSPAIMKEAEAKWQPEPTRKKSMTSAFQKFGFGKSKK